MARGGETDRQRWREVVRQPSGQDSYDCLRRLQAQHMVSHSPLSRGVSTADPEVRRTLSHIVRVGLVFRVFHHLLLEPPVVTHGSETDQHLVQRLAPPGHVQ